MSSTIGRSARRVRSMIAGRAARLGLGRPWYRTSPVPPRRRAPASCAVACLICGWTGSRFDGPDHCEGNRCPRCGSIGRDRFLIHSLFDRVPWEPGLRLLETSPRLDHRYRQAMARWFDYTTSDFDERAHRGSIKIDLQAIELPDESFDVVCSAHVLEHVPDTDRALAELHRIIRPGGWLVLQVPVLQTATAPPTSPEFHGDDTPVFWRFGFDLTDRLRAAGFDVRLLCTDELRNLAEAGATRWYDGPGGEFAADEIIADLPVDDLDAVADAEVARRSGFTPAFMYLTWVGRRRDPPAEVRSAGGVDR